MAHGRWRETETSLELAVLAGDDAKAEDALSKVMDAKNSGHDLFQAEE